jgi:hypothetical protein
VVAAAAAAACGRASRFKIVFATQYEGMPAVGIGRRKKNKINSGGCGSR